MTTSMNFFDAVLASVRLNRIYSSAIQAYDGNCIVAGTPKSGYYVQLVLRRQGGEEIFPQQIGSVPVAIIYADFAQQVKAESEKIIAAS